MTTRVTGPVDSGLQQIIGAALIDSTILARLLCRPLGLANEFSVSLGERRFLASIQPTSLEHFAQLVEDWLGGKEIADRPAAPAVRAKLAG